MTFGSLFTGIGGLDLGLERAGMRCLWQVESDEYARRVLQRHWPNVERFADVRNVGAANLATVDLICGGFPCQDLSVSNSKGQGLAGERSGLWFEYYRVICELRPRYALIENVANLIGNGLERILCDLAAIGYDAEWSTVSACSLGAPHTRERLFVLAYSPGERGNGRRFSFMRRQGDSYWETGSPERFVEIQAQVAATRKFRRIPDGLPSKLDVLRGLGNAVAVPVAEFIGRGILARD